jgi:predicted O-methyltransferase YrrM
MKHTKDSLELTRYISDNINNQTFHHHYHVLFDIANTFKKTKNITYVEIGCYAGGSACLMLQRPKTKVISIDTGIVINPAVVEANVNKLNVHHNTYHYVQGNSQTDDTVNRLKTLTDTIDILFIDGDHSYTGVRNDFNLYSNLVKSNGYIVFDDYRDATHSPEVKPAVDAIVNEIGEQYHVIGTLPNTYGARPDWLEQGNVFILQKI